MKDALIQEIKDFPITPLNDHCRFRVTYTPEDGAERWFALFTLKGAREAAQEYATEYGFPAYVWQVPNGDPDTIVEGRLIGAYFNRGQFSPATDAYGSTRLLKAACGLLDVKAVEPVSAIIQACTFRVMAKEMGWSEEAQLRAATPTRPSVIASAAGVGIPFKPAETVNACPMKGAQS